RFGIDQSQTVQRRQEEMGGQAWREGVADQLLVLVHAAGLEQPALIRAILQIAEQLGDLIVHGAVEKDLGAGLVVPIAGAAEQTQFRGQPQVILYLYMGSGLAD